MYPVPNYRASFLASGAEIAYLFWKRYEYTLNKQWLKEKAYPIMRGVCEFFRNFPNIKKADDGKYHVYHVNQGEHLGGATDTLDVLLAVSALFPATIRASEILDIDDDLRGLWKELIENLASLPTTDDPDSIGAPDNPGPVALADARHPFVSGRPRPGPDPINARYFDYDLASLENGESGAPPDGNPGLFTLVENTFKRGFPDGIPEGYAVRVMSGIAVMASRLGRASDFRQAVLNQLEVTDPAWDFCDFEGAGGQGALANRMTNREGANAIGAQRLGNAAYAVHESLCQSLSALPGDIPVIRFFPALPNEWDASFQLACRGGFLVEASRRSKIVQFIHIGSQCGGECRVRNPWPDSVVLVRENEKETRELEGELLSFSTQPGDSLYLFRKGAEPLQEDLHIQPKR